VIYAVVYYIYINVDPVHRDNYISTSDLEILFFVLVLSFSLTFAIMFINKERMHNKIYNSFEYDEITENIFCYIFLKEDKLNTINHLKHSRFCSQYSYLLFNPDCNCKKIEGYTDTEVNNEIFLNHLEILMKLTKNGNFYQLCFLLMHLELKNFKTFYVFSLLLKTKLQNVEIKYYHLIIRVLRHFIQYNYQITVEHMDKFDITFDKLVMFEYKYKDFHELIKKCFAINLKFWDSVVKSRKNPIHIMEEGLTMSDLIIKTTQMFEEIQKIYLNQTKTLKLYSYFLTFILQDFNYSNALLSLLKERFLTLKTYAKSFNQFATNEFGIILVNHSIEDNEFIIASLNSHAQDIIKAKITKANLIGKDVNYVFPFPFNIYHENMIQNKLRIDRLFEFRELYMINCEGDLIFVFANIVAGLNFTGRVCFFIVLQLNEGAEKKGLAFINTYGRIFSSNKYFKEVLSVDSNSSYGLAENEELFKKFHGFLSFADVIAKKTDIIDEILSNIDEEWEGKFPHVSKYLPNNLLFPNINQKCFFLNEKEIIGQLQNLADKNKESGVSLVKEKDNIHHFTYSLRFKYNIISSIGNEFGLTIYPKRVFNGDETFNFFLYKLKDITVDVKLDIVDGHEVSRHSSIHDDNGSVYNCSSINSSAISSYSNDGTGFSSFRKKFHITNTISNLKGNYHDRTQLFKLSSIILTLVLIFFVFIHVYRIIYEVDITNKLELNQTIKYLIYNIEVKIIFLVINTRQILEIKEGIRSEMFNNMNQTQLSLESLQKDINQLTTEMNTLNSLSLDTFPNIVKFFKGYNLKARTLGNNYEPIEYSTDFFSGLNSYIDKIYYFINFIPDKLTDQEKLMFFKSKEEHNLEHSGPPSRRSLTTKKPTLLEQNIFYVFSNYASVYRKYIDDLKTIILKDFQDLITNINDSNQIIFAIELFIYMLFAMLIAILTYKIIQINVIILKMFFLIKYKNIMSLLYFSKIANGIISNLTNDDENIEILSLNWKDKVKHYDNRDKNLLDVIYNEYTKDKGLLNCDEKELKYYEDNINKELSRSNINLDIVETKKTTKKEESGFNKLLSQEYIKEEKNLANLAKLPENLRKKTEKIYKKSKENVFLDEISGNMAVIDQAESLNEVNATNENLVLTSGEQKLFNPKFRPTDETFEKKKVVTELDLNYNTNTNNKNNINNKNQLNPPDLSARVSLSKKSSNTDNIQFSEAFMTFKNMNKEMKSSGKGKLNN